MAPGFSAASGVASLSLRSERFTRRPISLLVGPATASCSTLRSRSLRSPYAGGYSRWPVAASLTYALHMIAVCQARPDARGSVYYCKKIAEGKSRKEALGCLRRRIPHAVFKSLVVDSQVPSRSAA